MKLRRILATAMALTVVCGAQTALTAYQPVGGITANAADILDSGECGENLTWELDSEGTLSIIGEGDMADYEWDDSIFTCTLPWYSHRTKIHNIVIDKRVTKIGDCAFFRCEKVKEIKIPDGVKSIGYMSFDKSGIEKIEIPKGVTEIPKQAFYMCEQLTSVTIPNGVTTIEKYAFASCSSLSSISIPKSVENIAIDAFNQTPWLKAKVEEENLVVINGLLIATNAEKCTGNVVIPSNVTTIGEGVFAPNSAIGVDGDVLRNMTSVEIPSSVKKIGERAFNECGQLTTVDIADGVIEIGNYAFHQCWALQSITIPASVTKIGDTAITNGMGSNAQWIYTGTIYGYKGSTAEVYAKENDITFVALDQETTTTATPTTTEGTTTTTETTTTATTAASTSSTAQPSTTSTAASTTAQPTTTTTTSSSALDSRFVGKWELYKCEKNGEDTPFTPNGFELFADGEGKWTFVDGGKNHWTSVDGFLYVRDLTSLPIHIDKFEYLNGELVWKGMAEELDYNLAPETAEYDLNAYGEGIAFYYRRVEDSEQTTTATTTTSQPTTTTTASTTTETTTESTTTLSETSTASESTTEPVTTTATTPANEVSFGDPTGDGKIDAKDASFTLVEYAKLSTGGESSLTDAEKNTADVNKDGKVDSKDASTILQYYAYTSTGGTEPIEVYLGYEGDSVTTTTSDISTETTTTEATKTTTTTTNSTSTTTASTTTTTTTTEPVTTTTEHIDLVFESVENPCPEFDGLTFGWAEPYGTMEERRYQHVMWNFSYNYGFDCDCFFIDAYMRYFGYFHDTNHIWSDKCLSYVNSYGDEIIFYPDKNYIFINGTDYSLESAFGLDYDPSWTFIISNGYDFFVYDGEKMDSITKHIADNVR